MNSEFLRMKSLLEKTGLTFEEGGISFAELAAYAKGLEYAREKLESSEESIFITGSETNSLIRYADLLRLDADRFSFEELSAEIARRYALDFGQQSWSLAGRAFANVGSGEFHSNLVEIVFSGVEFDDLKELGKFIEAYVPLGLEVTYDGSGMTFDLWDEIAFSFNRYDGLGLPFDIIDNLRSDEIEQHE